ncbi:MAG: hypothetical protein V3W22_07080 [Thermoplasmata archaeon]
MPKERLFTTHATRPGDTFVEADDGFSCQSCQTVIPTESEIKAHVYERHGAGPGPLPRDYYIGDMALPEADMGYKCKLCWHPTPSLKHMLFHLGRAHGIRPLPWETSSSLSCKFYEVLKAE